MQTRTLENRSGAVPGVADSLLQRITYGDLSKPYAILPSGR